MKFSNIVSIQQQNYKSKKPLPLIIGFFDGIHEGHKKLFARAGKEFNVLTFTDIMSKGKMIFPFISRVTNLTFLNPYPKTIFIYDVKKNNDADFFIKLIKNKINPSKIIVGDKFKFGKGRKYGIKDLKKYFKVEVIKQNSSSTTKIKEFISNGGIQKANNLLSSPYYVRGVVVHGKHNGRKLGYRTANLKLSENLLLPKIGSYVGYSIFNDKIYPSAIFFGENIAESHLLNNFNQDIYGKKLMVIPLAYTSPFEKANSFSELKKVVSDKVESIKQIFKNDISLLK
jgi:riboflavin kinase/FMN adenylyltransferase